MVAVTTAATSWTATGNLPGQRVPVREPDGCQGQRGLKWVCGAATSHAACRRCGQGDGAIDWRDLRLIVGSIVVGADPGLDDEGQPLPDPGDDPEINLDADLNADGVVDVGDIALAAVNLSLPLSLWP